MDRREEKIIALEHLISEMESTMVDVPFEEEGFTIQEKNKLVEWRRTLESLEKRLERLTEPPGDGR